MNKKEFIEGLRNASRHKKKKKPKLRTFRKYGKTTGKCDVCAMDTFLVEDTGLCGPCCFGEAETINGNW